MSKRPHQSRSPIEPQPMALHYSRVLIGLALMLIAYLLFQAWVVVNLLAHLLNREVSWVLLAVFAGVGLLLAIGCLRMLLFREPVLIIDAHGITDVRRSPEFAAWDDIRSVDFGRGGFLCVRFRREATARDYVSGPLWLNAIRGLLEGRGHWNLRLLSLSGSSRRTILTAQAYLQWATHRRRHAEAEARASALAAQERAALARSAAAAPPSDS